MAGLIQLLRIMKIFVSPEANSGWIWGKQVLRINRVGEIWGENGSGHFVGNKLWLRSVTNPGILFMVRKVVALSLCELIRENGDRFGKAESDLVENEVCQLFLAHFGWVVKVLHCPLYEILVMMFGILLPFSLITFNNWDHRDLMSQIFSAQKNPLQETFKAQPHAVFH